MKVVQMKEQKKLFFFYQTHNSVLEAQKIFPDTVFTLFRFIKPFFSHTFLFESLSGLVRILKQYLVNIFISHHKNRNFSPRFGTVTQKITSYKNDIINHLMFCRSRLVYREKKNHFSLNENNTQNKCVTKSPHNNNNFFCYYSSLLNHTLCQVMCEERKKFGKFVIIGGRKTLKTFFLFT